MSVRNVKPVQLDTSDKAHLQSEYESLAALSRVDCEEVPQDVQKDPEFTYFW